MVLIGSARIDENGHATFGKAGDQTGKEVATQDWYLHSKGWYVIRAKSSKVAEDIATAMEHACSNNNIGYDQNERFTAYDWCKYNNGGNYDPALITAKVETDCSALVRLCLAYAGIFVGDFCTTDEYDVIMDTGRFINVTNPAGRNPDYLRRGDILVTKVKGHTVVVLTDGKIVAKAKGEQVDNFVLVEDNMAVTYKLRTIEIVNGVAMEGGDVLLVQEILRARGYKGRDGKQLKLDGHTGNDYETSNTMYAIACYIEDRLKNGVDLGGKDGWGPKCWADQNFIVSEA